jgi:hypothetical protein
LQKYGLGRHHPVWGCGPADLFIASLFLVQQLQANPAAQRIFLLRCDPLIGIWFIPDSILARFMNPDARDQWNDDRLEDQQLHPAILPDFG